MKDPLSSFKYTSYSIFFQSISSRKSHLGNMWSIDKCKEIHHKSVSHLIVYTFLDTFVGCSEFHLTTCHEYDWHQVNMSFNLTWKNKTESHLTEPDIISSFWSSSSLLWGFASLTQTQDPQGHRSTSNNIRSPHVRILPMRPSSSRNIPNAQNGHHLVHKITVISL